jgi:hypothetical protein
MTWREKAACRGSEDPVFFPLSNTASARAKAAAAAKDAYCRWCPVVPDCLAFADRTCSHGVWAGMSDEERAAERRRHYGQRGEAGG